ncbi:MAG: protein-disulfide reductase DsbD domain-containing protein [Paracoccaceae bacterium]
MIRALSLCLALLATPAAAQTSPHVTVDVRPGWTTERGTRMAALHLRLAPGWKTYWRAPGETGIPPRIAVAGGDAAVHWPVPEVTESFGLTSIGYAGEVVLPVEVAGDPGRLSGRMEIGICERVCVPVTLGFDAPLDRDGPDPAIAAALAAQAVAGRGPAVCAASAIEGGLRLTVRVPAVADPDALVVEVADPGIWVSPARGGRREGGAWVATVDLMGAVALDRSALTVTSLGSGWAEERRGCAPA